MAVAVISASVLSAFMFVSLIALIVNERSRRATSGQRLVASGFLLQQAHSRASGGGSVSPSWTGWNAPSFDDRCRLCDPDSDTNTPGKQPSGAEEKTAASIGSASEAFFALSGGQRPAAAAGYAVATAKDLLQRAEGHRRLAERTGQAGHWSAANRLLEEAEAVLGKPTYRYRRRAWFPFRTFLQIAGSDFILGFAASVFSMASGTIVWYAFAIAASLILRVQFSLHAADQARYGNGAKWSLVGAAFILPQTLLIWSLVEWLLGRRVKVELGWEDAVDAEA